MPQTQTVGTTKGWSDQPARFYSQLQVVWPHFTVSEWPQLVIFAGNHIQHRAECTRNTSRWKDNALRAQAWNQLLKWHQSFLRPVQCRFELRTRAQQSEPTHQKCVLSRGECTHFIQNSVIWQRLVLGVSPIPDRSPAVNTSNANQDTNLRNPSKISVRYFQLGQCLAVDTWCQDQHASWKILLTLQKLWQDLQSFKICEVLEQKTSANFSHEVANDVFPKNLVSTQTWEQKFAQGSPQNSENLRSRNSAQTNEGLFIQKWNSPTPSSCSKLFQDRNFRVLMVVSFTTTPCAWVGFLRLVQGALCRGMFKGEKQR